MFASGTIRTPYNLQNYLHTSTNTQKHCYFVLYSWYNIHKSWVCTIMLSLDFEIGIRAIELPSAFDLFLTGDNWNGRLFSNMFMAWLKYFTNNFKNRRYSSAFTGVYYFTKMYLYNHLQNSIPIMFLFIKGDISSLSDKNNRKYHFY